MHGDPAIPHLTFRIPHSPIRRGMTLIELLIVIVIIGVLVSSVMVASTSLIGKSKTRNTLAVLQIVADAAEQFKRSETEKPTITRNADYKRRFGLYPSDELEVFGTAPVTGIPIRLAWPAVIVPPAYAGDMKFYMDADCSDSTCQSTEHRDLAALIVAIETQGGEAAAILDRVSDRNRSAGVIGTDGKPAQFLSRPLSINEQQVNLIWDPEDLQIRYILDDWGVPIGYFAQRDHPGHGNTGTTEYPSKNMSTNGNWNEASTELIRLNGGQPVIFSYGPDGKEQLKKEVMNDGGAASLAGDFAPTNPTADNKEHVIDQPTNKDNVYSNDQLREKLVKGILQ